MPIEVVAWKTCRDQWTIKRKRGLGRSEQAARYDDDNDFFQNISVSLKIKTTKIFSLCETIFSCCIACYIHKRHFDIFRGFSFKSRMLSNVCPSIPLSKYSYFKQLCNKEVFFGIKIIFKKSFFNKTFLIAFWTDIIYAPPEHSLNF